MTGIEARNIEAQTSREEASARRENAVTAFFESLTGLVKSCQPLIDAVVKDAKNRAKG